MSGTDADLTDVLNRFFLATSVDECRRLLENHAELLSESAQDRASRLVALARLVADEPVRTIMAERAQVLRKCHQLHLQGRLDLNDVFTEFDGELLESPAQEAYSMLAAQAREPPQDWTATITSVASRLANPAHLPADSARAFDSCGHAMLRLDQEADDSALLDAAVWAFREAVQRAPTETAIEYEVVSDLAGALGVRYGRFKREEDRAEAAAIYRQKSRDALDEPSEGGLEATRFWSQLAAAGERWSEVAEACEFAVKLARKLPGHEAMVTSAGDLGAFALIKCHRGGGALIAMERTRAGLLQSPSAGWQTIEDRHGISDASHGTPVHRCLGDCP